MKKLEFSLLIIANQTILCQSGLVDNKIIILSSKCHYFWVWFMGITVRIVYAPISCYVLGSSGGLPIPWDTAVSIREIPSPSQLCATVTMSNGDWRVLGSSGKWDSLLLPHKKKSKWKRQEQRYADSKRHGKILERMWSSRLTHSSTEEWVCRQILALLNWDHQQVYEKSTVLTKSLNNSLWMK